MKGNREPEKMAFSWFGEVPSSCSLTFLLGPACVLLNYVLQTIFSGPVLSREIILVHGCENAAGK